MNKRIITNRIAACAAAMFVSFAAAPTAGYAAQTKPDGAETFLTALNIKTPRDYESAMEFRNTYGAFRIDTSNYKVWMVFEEPEDSSDTPRFQVQPVGNLSEVSHEIYHVPEDAEGCGAYQYEVVCYHHMPYCKTSVSLIDTTLPEGEQAVETYHFESSNSAYIQSTDLYKWVPDSAAEFEDFVSKRGEVSVYNNYMVFCMTDTAGTPYCWEESTGETVNQENVQKVMSGSFTRRQIPNPSGGPVYKVVVYEAVNDGPVQIDWAKRSFDPDEEPLDTLTGAFQIVNNGKHVLKPTDTWVELIDKGTAKRVDFSSYPLRSFSVSVNTGNMDGETTETGDTPVDTERVFQLLNNPSILSDFSPFFQDDQFTFELLTPPSYAVLTDGIEVTHFENGAAAIQFGLAYQIHGDADNDHILTPLDAHLMHRWLSGEKYITVKNWAATDVNGNGTLDAADLSMMKRELLETRKLLPTCTLNVKTTYGGAGVDGRDLGSGSFENTYTVRGGDIFYEDFGGNLMQNALTYQESYEVPVLRIAEVTDQCVRVFCGYADELQEIEVPYDEPQDELVFSNHIIFDGINYCYEVTFSDYTEPKQ